MYFQSPYLFIPPYSALDVDATTDGTAGAVRQCSLMDDDGKVCGKTLFSLCSLRQHMRHAKGGQHGQPSLHSVVARAQCPPCLSHLSS